MQTVRKICTLINHSFFLNKLSSDGPELVVRNQRLGQNNRDLAKSLLLFSGEKRSGTRHGAVAGACKEPQQQTGFCASGEGTGGHDKCPSTVPK